jgi:hypothetical protein
MKNSSIFSTLFALLACLYSSHANATLTTIDIDPVEFNLPTKLPFENRAACALDSKKPTQSAFLIIDSYNAGKQIDSWLQGSELNSNSVLSVEQGLKIFRLSLSETWMTITQEILNGRLPLLKANPDDQKIEAKYSQILAHCEKRFPCEEMDQYLGSIFKTWKSLNKDTGSAYSSYFDLDRFARHPELLKGRNKPQSSCLYIKRFSELQSYLSHDRPDQSLLQKIALATTVKKDLFTDCFDDSDSISSRRFILQLDISEAGKHNWKKYGFDFWYSVKLYFSYAWRHPEIILDSVHPLNGIFKNLAIEQMIQLIPAGCQSIDRPECSQSQVSMDIYRSLGKMGPTELDKPLPDRPEQTLIRDPLAVKREDAAFLPENEEADQWLKSYQDRIIQKRGLLKQRLLLAMSQFELLSSAITTQRISSELNKLKSEMPSDQILYQKMQVLCSEIDVAIRPDVNLLEKRFESTLQIQKFKNLVESSSDLQLSGMIDFYQSIAKTTFPICEQIRIEKLWKKDTVVSTPYYSAWFRDLSGTWEAPVPQPVGSSKTPDFLGMGELFNKKTISNSAFLTQEKINSSGIKETSTICADASDCVRMLLKSMVDLYAVSAWSDAMMPANEWIQSPNLNNPWASSTACKVYDPWFATKQAMVGLVTDLTTTVVTGIAPIPAYLAVQPKHRDVKGFALDPKGDDLFLKPIKKGPAADVTLGVDLGPWIGIPCAAVFSPTSTRPQIGGYYAVAGVRAEACTGKDNNRLIVNDAASSSSVNQKHTFSGCAMCYLNPYSAARGAATILSYANPYLKIAVGAVFSGISLAKKLANPIDVPHRYNVDLDEVSSTFEKYSFIPKHCVRRLSKGKSCRHAFLTKDERKDDRQ